MEKIKNIYISDSHIALFIKGGTNKKMTINQFFYEAFERDMITNTIGTNIITNGSILTLEEFLNSINNKILLDIFDKK